MSHAQKNERNSALVAQRARRKLGSKGWLLVGGLIAAIGAAGCTASNSALPALPGNGTAPALGFAPGAPPPGALADAVVGNAYNAITVSTTGASGAGNITCSANIVLPDGFSVTTNSTNCVIGLSGATVTGSAQQISFSLHIHDSGNGADLFRNYSINVHSLMALAVNVDPGTAAGFAVAGRAYGTGAKTPVTFTASGGISPYIFTITGAPPTGITCVTAAATVTCSGNSVTGAPGNSPFTVMVNDTGAPPTTPVSQKQIVTSFTVIAEIAIAVSPDPATNPAVTGRAYGQAPQAPPTFTATGGLTPLNNFIVTGTPPAPITCTGAASVVCSGGAVTGSTSAIMVSISDNGNTTTPANSKGLPKTFTVNPILALTGPGAAPPTAVNSRAYGQGGNCTPGPNCAPVAVGVAGGLGGYSAAINGTTGGGTAFACALAGANYNCSSANVTDTTANMTFALTTTDKANATTPAANSAPTNVTIAVNGKLALTPPAAVPAAVNGRAFGQGAGCTGGACAPLQYTITGGLGNYTAGTLSDGTDAMACAVAAGTYSCSTAKINAAAGAPTLVMTGPETGNASTPSANVVDNSKTLTIDAAVVVTSNLGSSWPTGVTARAYGTGTGCTPVTNCTAAIYTAANGIAPYVFPAAPPATFPGNFTCTSGATTYTCNSASVGAAGSFNPAVTVADTGNVSTPASTVSTDPQSTITTSVTIAGALTLTPPGAAPVNAVNGRRYGMGAGCPNGATNCAPVPFTVAGGTGNYSASINDTTLGGTVFTCPLTGATYNCSTPNVSDPAGSMAVAVSTTDLGNSTTPTVNSAPVNTAITVNGVMTATPPTAVPAAVTGRAYGFGAGCTGGACAPLQYAVAGGLGNYVAGTLGDGTDSMACSVAGGTYSCSIGAIAAAPGSPALAFSASENGNASTPGGTATDNAKTLTINSKLSLASSLGAVWPDAITGRAFGSTGTCTPIAACAPEVLTASNGIAPYVFPGATPASFPAGFSCVAAAAMYTCSSANVTAAAGPFSPSVTAVDTGNATTPASTLATDPASQFTGNITVGGALTITPPAGTPPTAVTGRPYGSGSGCSPTSACATLNFTVSGGAGVYAATLNDTTGGGTSVKCTLAGGTTYQCGTTGNVADAAGTMTVSLTGSDNGNQSTPGGTGSAANKGITVNPVMTLTPPASVPAAVTGRAFGTGAGCTGGACVAIQYTISGGLGNYQAGTLGDGTDSLACGLAAGTYSCSSNKITGALSGLTLTMSTSENGNASTPGAPISDATKTLTINAKLSLASSQGATWANAVTSRAYGTGNGCTPTSACSAEVFTASNGIAPYTFPASTPASFPGGFSCTSGATTYTCTSANVTAAAAAFSPSVTVVDAGNASTPAATIATDPASQFTASITVNGVLTLTPPAGTPATAVFGRRYGTGAGCPSGATSCAPIPFTVSGGAGAYAASLSDTTGGGTVYTCPLTGAIYNCSAPNMADVATSTISLMATDAGNQSTPGGTGSATNKNVTVNAAMTLTPPGSVPAAVTGRAFGTGNGCSPTSACTAIQYMIVGGLGNYQPGTLTDGTDSPVCVLAAATYSCSSAKITGTVSGLTLTMSASENGNASTPGALAADTSQTLTIDEPLALNINLGNTWPDAVTGRTFGTGSDCAPGGTATCTAAVYTASNGISPYVFPGSTPASFPGGFSCVAGATTYTCTSANVTATIGSFSPSVAATDTGNASTPAATIASDPLSTITSTVTVDPEIVIQNSTTLSNGQLGEAYSVEFFCRTASVCGGTGTPNNAAAQYTWSASTNNITGTAFTTTFPEAQPGDSTFAGTTTASGAAETVHITVADNGNGSTPSCASLGVPTCPAGTYTAEVLTSTAFVDASNSAILPVDTSTAALTIGTAIAGDTGGKPNRPSVSGNGTDAFITDPAINEVYILDTQGLAISKKVTNTQGLANNAGDTTSVVVGPQKAPSQGGFEANSVFAYVYNPSAGSHNVQAIDGDPTSGTFGTVTKSITLTNTVATGSATGAGDIRITPTLVVGATRVTRLYVLRPDGDEVCIIDAEPTSAGFQTQITPATHNGDNCIALGSTSPVVAQFMTISPDGRFAFVSKTDNVGTPTGKAFVDVIDIDPNSGTRDTVLSHVDVTTALCFVPAHLRTTTDGQTLWVVCSDASTIVPITTALVNTTQFTVGTAVAAGTATSGASDLAFRSDGALGVVTLKAASDVLPVSFTTAPPTPGTALASTGVTNPDGIDHIPDPSLNITTSALPNATHGQAYASSIVAAGLNPGYTFTDVTSVTTLASLGLTLNSNGRITSASAGAAGTYTFSIQVTDQSLPLPNNVIKTISLTIN